MRRGPQQRSGYRQALKSIGVNRLQPRFPGGAAEAEWPFS